MTDRKKRFDKNDHGVPNISEKSLKRIAFSYLLQSPGFLSWLIRLLITSYMLGAISMVVLLVRAPWLFSWLNSLWR